MMYEAHKTNKNLMGFWTSGSDGVRFYVYKDKGKIVTSNTKMDEKWPSIKALRFIVPDIKS